MIKKLYRITTQNISVGNDINIEQKSEEKIIKMKCFMVFRGPGQLVWDLSFISEMLLPGFRVLFGKLIYRPQIDKV